MKRIATPKAIHICNSHKPTLNPKIAKEYDLPAHWKVDKMDKTLGTTTAIRNAGKVLNMNIVAINKIGSNLKVWFFKIPHYA